MNVIKTAIEGVLVLEPKGLGDARGFFVKSFEQKSFNAAGREVVSAKDSSAPLLSQAHLG